MCYLRTCLCLVWYPKDGAEKLTVGFVSLNSLHLFGKYENEGPLFRCFNKTCVVPFSVPEGVVAVGRVNVEANGSTFFVVYSESAKNGPSRKPFREREGRPF